MKILIVEDEILLAEELAENLKKIDRSIEIMAHLSSVRESVEWLQENNCDLIFMDIHLNDGLSFYIFDKTEVTAPIVFTTAYDDYAIKAFEVNSIAYLLKPFDKQDLEKVLKKYKSLHQQSNLSDLLDFVKKETNQYLERITLSLGKLQKPIRVNEIAYFMSEGRLVFAITKDSKKYFYDTPLYELEQQLNPKDFFRVNRSFIVNYESIEEIVSHTKGRILLKLKPKQEQEVTVSSEKAKSLKEWLSL